MHYVKRYNTVTIPKDSEFETMKVLSALVSACVVITLVQADLNITDQQKARLLGHHNKCSKEVAVPEDTIQKLFQGGLPEEQIYKDYMLCISKRIGYQNDAGEVQKDIVIRDVRDSIKDPSNAEQYVDKCLVTGNPADVVYKMVKCLQETTPTFLLGK